MQYTDSNGYNRSVEEGAHGHPRRAASFFNQTPRLVGSRRNGTLIKSGLRLCQVWLSFGAGKKSQISQIAAQHRTQKPGESMSSTGNTARMQRRQVFNVIVTGASHTGKRTFINTIREREAVDNAAAFNMAGVFGRVRLPEASLFLAAAPGNRPLAFLNDVLNNEVLGAVVLVDSVRAEQFGEARAILNRLDAQGIPALVALTRQDHADAWSVADIRIALRIRPGTPFGICDPRDREHVKRALSSLLTHATRLMSRGVATSAGD